MAYEQGYLTRPFWDNDELPEPGFRRIGIGAAPTKPGTGPTRGSGVTRSRAQRPGRHCRSWGI